VHWLDAIEAEQIRNRVADVTAEVSAIRWSADETRLLFAAGEELARIPLGAASTEPLRLLARHFPLAVSLAYVTHTADPQDARLVLWNLPSEFSEMLMRVRTVGLLATAADATALGIGLRDIDILGDEQHSILAERLGQFGLSGAYGMLIARRQTGQNRELECIVLFWDNRTTGPTRREAALVGALQPFVANAMARTRQPSVLLDEPLNRNAQSHQLGLALFGADGSVIAHNQRASVLVSALDTSFASGCTPSALCRLARRLGIPGEAGVGTPRRLAISVPDRNSIVDVRAHSLQQVSHVSGPSLWALGLQELDRTGNMQHKAPVSFLQTLPPRQRQVATLLARTGLSYAEIADQLGLAPGTVRKHAEWAFRRLGVNRRFELTAMLLVESEPEATPTENGSSRRSATRGIKRGG
jgi:DNA-binding NarL/FixJ family response regulator